MAAKMIKGEINDDGVDMTRSDLVGTETITASVAANEIAIVVDDGVDMTNDAQFEAAIHRLLTYWRENQFVS